MRRILVTGGCGFIGSVFVRRHLNQHPTDEVWNLDALTYAGNLSSLADVADNPRYSFIHGSICDGPLVEELISSAPVDAVVNFAAESHVDRSIEAPDLFLQTNVLGTQTLLEAARRNGVRRFLQVSTDEVYGSLGAEGKFSETTALAPRSPYSASKASADLLCSAYHHTFGMDVVITRCCNNYGPYQFPEKLIPLMILNAMGDRPLPVYGDGLQVREWLHVEDHCAGIEAVLERGKAGEVYNLGSGEEMTNLSLVQRLLKLTGKDESLISHVTDRLGHDRRYAIDSSRAQNQLGWSAQVSFENGLAATVQWYRDNTDWWQPILSGEYRNYYRKMYDGR
ncbi:dTDP-glucose 4,6-dehydratase [candidate division BRC1 bacterium HGW-BRC1-1]|nr:MAG: dTDP-glucose 4,6-dehydratase [candidate division BRC1 bacterium HGW-BRC1-1]